jgi:hypothetical protein
MLTTGKNPVFGLLSSIIKVFLLFFFVSSHTSRIVSAKNNQTHFLDRFNYDTTTDREDGFIDYGPKDWGKIKCDERTTESLDQCEGYPHKWHEGINFTITDNYCRWCPVGSDECGRHHQSPINLLREVGLNPNTSSFANECIVSLCLVSLPCLAISMILILIYQLVDLLKYICIHLSFYIIL